MVQEFYSRVQEDGLLGPVFRDRIDGDWPAHLDRMVEFWSTVLQSSGRYRGNPIEAHARIPGIDPSHFDRWLEIFRLVVHETFPESVAEDVYGRASRMRAVLERNLNRGGEAPG